MMKYENDYREIIQQINDGYAMLFLGAGSTRNCKKPGGAKGLTGQELATELLRELNGGKDPGFSTELMQAAEFFASEKASARSGLDRFIQDRLADLQPTIGHYILAAFPWRAVVTTNYNRVAEDAWGHAHANGFASKELIAIKTDADIIQHSGDAKSIRLYKPHGCISIQKQKSNRMVLTSLDYFESERIRKDIFKEIKAWAQDCTTVFVGYSMTDFTFRNIFYTLYAELGQWANRSYSVNPNTNALHEQWLSRAMEEGFKTRVMNETFDSFMLKLLLHSRKCPARLLKEIVDRWDEFSAENTPWGDAITLAEIRALTP